MKCECLQAQCNPFLTGRMEYSKRFDEGHFNPEKIEACKVKEVAIALLTKKWQRLMEPNDSEPIIPTV